MSRRKILFRIVILFTIIITFTGCSASSKSESTEYSYDMDSAAPSYDMPQDNSAGESKEEAKSEEAGLSYNDDIFAADVERMMIYTGSFKMEVNDIQEASKTITDLVREENGYLIKSSQSENSNRIYAHFEFRVPVKSYHSLYNQLEHLTSIGKILYSETDGKEVTEEYLDLESRLKAKKVYEERLLEFLSRAEKTEDLLRISQDLNRVQEEIEQIQGRQKYLKHHSDYSTLIVDVEQYKNKSAPTASTWEKSVNGFNKSIENIVQVFNSLFILLISLAPVLVLILILMFIAWKMGRVLLRGRNQTVKDKVTDDIVVDKKEDKE